MISLTGSWMQVIGQTWLVLERDRVPRGSTALSSGFIPAAGTRFQRDKGIEIASLFGEQPRTGVRLTFPFEGG